MKMRLLKYGVCLLACLCLTGAPPVFALHSPITIDGNSSDWIGVPSGTVHGTVTSLEEWIYTGGTNDYRTDPCGGSPCDLGKNFDLTQVRMTHDGTYLYFLFRLQDVNGTAAPESNFGKDEVFIHLGIDLDLSGSDPDLNFVGDDSGIGYNPSNGRPEWIFAIHDPTPTGISVIEAQHDSTVTDGANPAFTWYTFNTDSYISTANDLVEIRLDMARLGITGTSTIRISVATFDNAYVASDGRCGFVDATVDYPNNDCIDVLGGTPGVNQNAWDRDLSDSSFHQGVDVDLSSLPVKGWELYGD